MGYHKQLLAKQEHQRDVAISVAVKAGVLRSCEFHGDVFASDEFADAEPAYRLANARFSRGELHDVFETRTEMTDAIKAVVDEFVLDYCPRCEKMLRD